MKKCILMGNGPSLNKVNIDDLREVDTFSFNRAYIAYEEWDFYPTYFACIDGRTFRTIYEDFKKMVDSDIPIKKYFTAPCGEMLDDVNHKHKIVQTNYKNIDAIADSTLYFGQFRDLNFPPNFNGTCPLDNVSIWAAQFAYLIGYTHVGMVGVDCRYVPRPDVKNIGGGDCVFTSDNDPNHFRSDYFGEGAITTHHHLNNGVAGNDLGVWSKFKDSYIKQSEFKLFSCTENSRVNGIFKYMPLDEFLEL